MDHERFKRNVKELYRIVRDLEEMFPGRSFTPDGHMVGSLGECLVADAYNLELRPSSNPGFDAEDSSKTQVEIKATQGDRVAFRSCPEHAIVIRINKDGAFDEYYNGPGTYLRECFEGKKRPSNGQFQISLSKLTEIAKRVSDSERIPNRNAS